MDVHDHRWKLKKLNIIGENLESSEILCISLNSFRPRSLDIK